MIIQRAQKQILHNDYGCQNLFKMKDARAFVDGFFAALSTQVPQSAASKLRASHQVFDSCLRLGEVATQEENRDKAASIALAVVEVVAAVCICADANKR